ncbi:MAG TPA: hypothetical protein VHU19_16335 [Pyrinomonadaceae bacterium]|jgi:hypothetical protein|nr:hypothetical protein [Pyrinomonadaceae bacterium]
MAHDAGGRFILSDETLGEDDLIKLRPEIRVRRGQQSPQLGAGFIA